MSNSQNINKQQQLDHSPLTREFLPAALEVIETPPSPTLRRTALFMAILFISTVIYSIVGKIDVVAIAQGKIVPVGQIKVIQSLETAVVRQIHVKEGMRVDVGQLIIELDPSDATANIGQLNVERNQASLEAAAAQTLLAGNIEAFIPPNGASNDLIQATRIQADEELKRHRSIMASFQSELKQKGVLIEANENRIKTIDGLLAVLTDRHATLNALLQKSFTQKPPVQLLEQEIIERRGERATILEQIKQIRAEMETLNSRREGEIATFRAAASERNLKAIQKASSLEQQINKEQTRENYRKLIAPVAGTVLGLKTNTLGAVVQSGDILMSIVPEGAELEVEAAILNKDIGFIEEGQPVEIKLETFPFTRFGTITGKINTLSRDSIEKQNVGLVYAVKISLDKKHIQIENKSVPLSSGMVVEAEIKIGQRRIIEIFLSPILKAKNEALRER